MPRVLTQAMVTTELATVADRLADAKITGPARLALLRRQAELGDLRDALKDRARARAS
ncbi:hypothetical protein NBH00_17815 [Paraconexibacter antarcticus]|jgi:hypothetical protein|uniref:Uncharacterized protein n=1 Tax=Paraconexibacter antarcticus TaxID=2949664 RepID=A0ABY5DRA0_9ACTN|nr:hypothetical protein [Paraconexibacter antarcticus]UTI63210.1 hypothetical protein NBH00_17815 [Paraconexibacter antarcticus]